MPGNQKGIIDMNMLRSLALATLALTMSVPMVQAQDEPTPSAELVLTSADGKTTHSYEVDDISISVMRNSGYDLVSEPRADVSASISGVRPLDAALLEWAQVAGGEDAFRKATVTVPASSEEADDAMTYELTGARVTGLTASHSVPAGSRYLTMSLGVRGLSINGTAMK